MSGVPCVRDLRIPVATVISMLADGMTEDEILELSLIYNEKIFRCASALFLKRFGNGKYPWIRQLEIPSFPFLRLFDIRIQDVIEALTMEISINRSGLKKIADQFDIETIRLFGSAYRNELTADSDIDILVQFKDGSKPSLFTLGKIQQELTREFSREVDLKTEGFFPDEELKRVLGESEIAYG